MKTNSQRPEPRIKVSSTLDVHSMFLTIQGEGPFTGTRALFLRLGGCNLQCPLCDTDYTSVRERYFPQTILDNVVDAFIGMDNPLLVLTGGEPLRQPIGPLLWLLTQAGIQVQIESNGVFEPDSTTTDLILAGKVHLIVSPKTSHIHESMPRLATAFKYVLDADSIDPVDGLPIHALGHPAKPRIARPGPGFAGPIYVNPCDNQNAEHNKRNLRAVIDAAMEHGYIAGIQLHKLLDLP